MDPISIQVETKFDSYKLLYLFITGFAKLSNVVAFS